MAIYKFNSIFGEYNEDVTHEEYFDKEWTNIEKHTYEYLSYHSLTHSSYL